MRRTTRTIGELVEITGVVSSHFPPRGRGPDLFKLAGGEAVKVWADKHPGERAALLESLSSRAPVVVTVSEITRTNNKNETVTELFAESVRPAAGGAPDTGRLIGGGGAAPNTARQPPPPLDPTAARIKASWAITNALEVLEPAERSRARILEVSRELLEILDTLTAEL